MRLACVGYIAPPGIGRPEVFLRNLAKFPAKTDMVLYSDHPWEGTFRLKASPEVLKQCRFPDGKPNKFTVQNGAFFTGVRLAFQRGYTHAIILEDDVRFGKEGWDQIIWEEFFAMGRPIIAAGSLATYNPANFSPEAMRLWTELIRRNTRKNFPVPTYGWLGAGVKGRTAVFPNGALAVYDLNWLSKFFDLENTAATATSNDAWDFAIGFKIWDVFEEMSYDVVGMMESYFSGYGNIVTTEEERIKMLMDGKCCAVHQIKSDFCP